MAAAVIGITTQTSRDSVISNLKSWLGPLGVTEVPDTLIGVPIDQFVSAISALVFLAAIVWLFYPEFRRGPRFRGFMTPYEALTYMATGSAWGAKTRSWRGRSTHELQIIEARKDPIDEAFDEFQIQAQKPDTKIRVWGLENGKGAPAEISSSFWLTNRFHSLDTLTGQGNRTQPTLYLRAKNGDDITYYTDLHVDRSGVYKTWRPMLSPLAIYREWKRRKQEKAYFRSIGYL